MNRRSCGAVHWPLRSAAPLVWTGADGPWPSPWGGRASECGAKTGWTGLAAGGHGPSRPRGRRVQLPVQLPGRPRRDRAGSRRAGHRLRRMAGSIALWRTSRARARARATWRAVGGAAGVMPRAAVMASAHRGCGPGTRPRAWEAAPERRRGLVVMGSRKLGAGRIGRIPSPDDTAGRPTEARKRAGERRRASSTARYSLSHRPRTARAAPR